MVRDRANLAGYKKLIRNPLYMSVKADTKLQFHISPFDRVATLNVQSRNSNEMTMRNTVHANDTK